MQRPFLTHADHAKGAHRGVADDIMAIEEVRSFHDLRVLCASTAPDMSKPMQISSAAPLNQEFTHEISGLPKRAALESRLQLADPCDRGKLKLSALEEVAPQCTQSSHFQSSVRYECGRSLRSWFAAFFRRSKPLDRLLLQRVGDGAGTRS